MAAEVPKIQVKVTGGAGEAKLVDTGTENHRDPYVRVTLPKGLTKDDIDLAIAELDRTIEELDKIKATSDNGGQAKLEGL